MEEATKVRFKLVGKMLGIFGLPSLVAAGLGLFVGNYFSKLEWVFVGMGLLCRLSGCCNWVSDLDRKMAFYWSRESSLAMDRTDRCTYIHYPFFGVSSGALEPATDGRVKADR